MRMIGGSMSGRRLKAPAGHATRPTSDRVREALFNILGPPPDQTRVLDLFAGSGALGLEALSRGATHATFVDAAKPALNCLRDNIKTLGVTPQTTVVSGDSIGFLKRSRAAAATYRWIFVDPPYAAGLFTAVLEQLGTGDLLDFGARIIVEHDRRTEPGATHGCLIQTDRRRYGDTILTFYDHRHE